MTNTIFLAGKNTEEDPSDDLLEMFDLFDEVMALGDSDETSLSDIEQGAILVVAQLIARKIDNRIKTKRH